jgi:hypothetical protein
MKNIDEYYKVWLCGEHHTTNSEPPVHDSAEACDFAEYYFTEKSKEIAIKVIKEIREKEQSAQNQKRFCTDHQFTLEAEKFRFAEDELRRTCRIVENGFDTGYVS